MTSQTYAGFRAERGLIHGLALAVTSGLIAVACNKDAAVAAEQPRPATATTSGDTAERAAAATTTPASTTVQGGAAETEPAAGQSSSVKEANFELSLVPSGAYQAGSAGKVEVVLQAKDPFKVNDKYPYKFKPQASEGVKYAADVIKDPSAVKLETKRAVMTVDFTPAAAGKKTIAGTFSFSVCTEERCLIEKRDLSLAIDVK